MQGVTVIARTWGEASTILGYGVTNSAGQYQISLSSLPVPTKIRLTFSALGFQTVIVESEMLENKTVDVVLSVKATFIDEVVVQGRPTGFKEKGDTTRYAISSYIDNTERNLEDLLAKLPGIEVSDKGVVSFKGKRIEKVLIGGEDFFSSNYTVLTKNIAVDLLQGIEAVEHYDESTVLKDYRSSDKVVLNLKLKTNRLSKPMGTIDLSAGSGHRHSVNSSLFSLAEKLKIGFFLNKNSIGEQAISDIRVEQEDIGDKLPLSFELPQYFELPQSRYLANNDFLGATQINYTWKPSYKISYAITVEKAKARTHNAENVLYRFYDTYEDFEFNNDYKHQLRTKRLSNNIALKLKFKDKAELLYDGLFMFSKTDRSYTLARLDLDRLIQQNNIKDETATAHYLTYNYKLNQRNALSLNYSFRYKESPFQRSSMEHAASAVAAKQYPDFFSGNQSFNYATSQSDVHLQLYGVNSFLKYELGVNGLVQMEILQNYPLNDYADFRLQNRSVSSCLSLVKGLKYGELGVKGTIRSVFLSIKDAAPKEGFLFVEPKFWMHYNWNRKFKLSIDYELLNRVSQLFQLQPQNIFVDYFTMQRGINIIHTVLNHMGTIRLRYADQNRQLIASLSATLNLSQNPYVNKVSLVGEQLLLNEFYASALNLYYLRNQLQTDYYLSFIKSNLRTTLRHSSIMLASVIGEDDLQRNRMENSYAGIKLNTAFLEKPFDFGVEWGKTWSQLRGTAATYGKNAMQKVAFTGIFKLPYKSTFILAADNYYRSTYLGSTNATFIDARYVFPLKKADWKITLAVRNLLNEKVVAAVQNTNYIFSESFFELNSAYVLLSLRFNLIK